MITTVRALIDDLWRCHDPGLQRWGRVIVIASVVAVGAALFRLVWDVAQQLA